VIGLTLPFNAAGEAGRDGGTSWFDRPGGMSGAVLTSVIDEGFAAAGSTAISHRRGNQIHA
jgi:hypothetical protein